jgi:DNA-binding response OmpR family regulator
VPRILLVEDEQSLRVSLEDRLAFEGYEVRSCADGRAALEVAGSGGFDLILLDVMLPGLDGFRFCKELRDRGDQVPVLFLTARADPVDTVTGFRLGGDDYVSKPFDTLVLLARIDALIRRDRKAGARRQDSGKRAFGAFQLDLDARELSKGGARVELHAVEYRLLSFLARNPNRVVSREELLQQVWRYDSSVTTRTVDVHVSRLRKKLGAGGRHLLTVRGQGYRFEP